MCAFVEAFSLGARPDDIVMVSLGTGIATRKIAYEDAKDWGALGWVRPIISVMMEARPMRRTTNSGSFCPMKRRPISSDTSASTPHSTSRSTTWMPPPPVISRT